MARFSCKKKSKDVWFSLRRELKGDDERGSERERSATITFRLMVGEAAMLYLHVEYEPFFETKKHKIFSLAF